ncbi:spore coat protein [Alkalihalobacillus sp. LMS39]|uniref:spore coat protein n=1 Tax=Alkalihalobacillus sp. LMS39 TaxID=2924032 RepID=UPI001FB40532|nr:spore coat protein [Alkalihalobacillus sp. LMS39]UOE92168.1 spore coat protein [Alkalihalobacillus sp. LMS39]
MWQKPCTQIMPAVVHPTKCNVRQKCCEYIVPNIHPSHTTNVTHHNYKHVHTFPHTESFQQTVSHQNIVAPPGVAGAGFGPGGSPGAGFGAPGVAGAGFGPAGAPGAGAYGPGFAGPRPRRPFF